jgi:hypothetical protein
MTGKRKGTYKITNWSKYNKSLVDRGDITVWFSDEVISDWQHSNKGFKVGRPFTFSDTAIETMLVLRELFKLPYRQTEGFTRSLANLMGLDMLIPHYSALAKRAAKLNVSLDVVKRSGAIDIVVDSTGLKVYGEGEWKMRKHGKSKRRTWQKLHLAVDAGTQEIVAQVLTENSGHDSHQVEGMLEEIESPVESFSGDGAYDTWKVYELLDEHKIRAVIPPQHNAKIKQHGNSERPPLARDEAIRGIRLLGRRRWKEKVGYHRRSLSETAMYRIKTIFGEGIKNRLMPNQRTEVRLRCKILNYFTQLGLPDFVWN